MAQKRHPLVFAALIVCTALLLGLLIFGISAAREIYYDRLMLEAPDLRDNPDFWRRKIFMEECSAWIFLGAIWLAFMGLVVWGLVKDVKGRLQTK